MGSVLRGTEVSEIGGEELQRLAVQIVLRESRCVKPERTSARDRVPSGGPRDVAVVESVQMSATTDAAVSFGVLRERMKSRP